jgi:hypothetical protein
MSAEQGEPSLDPRPFDFAQGDIGTY